MSLVDQKGVYSSVPSFEEGESNKVNSPQDDEVGVLQSENVVPEDLEKQTDEFDPAEDSCMRQLRLFLDIAVPTTLIQITVLILGSVSTSYVGTHLGRHELVGFSVSNLAANLLGQSFLFGLMNGMDTLAPRAYGAKDYARVGYLAQTSVFVCLVLAGFIVVVFWNAGPILRMLKQPEAAIPLAERFLRIYCISLPADILYNTIRRFLWSQNIVSFFIVIGLVTLLFHRFYLYLFITYLELGFEGAPIAHVASNYTSMLMSVLYLVKLAPYKKETWPGINLRESINAEQIKAYLRLGVPGILSNNEWWYWEVVCIYAGMLGELELASHTVAYNLVPLAYMLPFGLSVGSTTRLSTLIAENRIETARRVANTVFFLGVIAGLFSASLGYLFRTSFISAFTGDDKEAFDLTISIWWLVCLFCILDAVGGALGGVLRGLAAQLSLSLANTFALWIVGLPFMYVWTFKCGNGIVGIWQAMVLNDVLLVALVLVMCYRWIDWNAVVPK